MKKKKESSSPALYIFSEGAIAHNVQIGWKAGRAASAISAAIVPAVAVSIPSKYIRPSFTVLPRGCLEEQ